MSLFLDVTTSINPTRNFNLLYVILDSLFIILLLFLLIKQKKYVTLLWSIFGGILYFIVDYGYFHLLSGSRHILVNGNETALNTFLVLLWMSLSYGITNFLFIWLCLKKDKHLKEYLILIIMWWLVLPSIAFIGGDSTITTFRTTTKYHSYMAIILVIGYLGLIIYNIFHERRLVELLPLLLIGISVQFSWEFALLINGIRPMNSSSITTLIINSLIETNLGMPYIYLIFRSIYKHYNEDLSKIQKVDA